MSASSAFEPVNSASTSSWRAFFVLRKPLVAKLFATAFAHGGVGPPHLAIKKVQGQILLRQRREQRNVMSNETLYMKYKRTLQEVRDRHGDHTLLLMECGSFFEVSEDGALEIADSYPLCVCRDVLNLSIVHKRLTLNKYIYQAGVPTCNLRRHLMRLLHGGYNVALMEQQQAADGDSRKKIARCVTRVLSPGCAIDDEDGPPSCGLLACISMDETQAEVAIFDASLGTVRLADVHAETRVGILDQLRALLTSEGCAEVVVHTKSVDARLRDELGLTYTPTLLKECHPISETRAYQIEVLSDAFAHRTSLFASIHERLGLDSARESANLVRLVDFVRERDKDLARALTLMTAPSADEDALRVYNRAFDRLALFEHRRNARQSVFHACNRTSTRMGERALRDRLARPSTQVETITTRLNLVDKLLSHLDVLLPTLKLDDIERLYRRMAVGRLTPRQLFRLHATLVGMGALYKEATPRIGVHPVAVPTAVYQEMIAHTARLAATFDLELCSSSQTFEFGLLKRGIDLSIDQKRDALSLLQEKVVGCCGELERLAGVTGIVVKHDRDACHFETTKTRAKKIEAVLHKAGDPSYTLTPSTKTTVVIRSSLLNTIHTRTIGLWDDLATETNEICTRFLDQFYESTHERIVAPMIRLVVEIDVALSSARMFRERRYTRPTVLATPTTSRVDIIGVRHPVIERLVEVSRRPYVVNDVALASDSSMVLYGFNSVGKSSLIKAIGIAVIMAQAGLYVAAESMEIAPYTRLFTRAGNDDNLFEDCSSYVHECTELRRIWKLADARSLALTDEMCSSTEHGAATRVLAAFVYGMSKRGVSFLCATHCFDLHAYIHTLPSVRTMHRSVDCRPDGALLFDRTIRPGLPAQRNYGVVIAEKVVDDPQFSALVRSMVLSEPSKRPRAAHRSRYNPNVTTWRCEMCDTTPRDGETPLETHHIVPQATADADGFLGTRHIHAAHLLVVLCAKCHDAIHSGQLHVYGRTVTDRGTRLNYAWQATTAK